MAEDIFTGKGTDLHSPSRRLRPVTPSDSADLPDGVCRGLHVRGAGDIAVIDADGNTATLASNAAQYHPVRVARVLATGTTATGVVALY